MKWKSIGGLALLVCGLAGSCLGAEGQKLRVIHAGQLFDGTSDRLLSNQAIVIQGDRIVEVGPAGSVKVPARVEEINLESATVLPGLIDGHSHVLRFPGLTGYETLLRDSLQYRTIIAVANAKTDLEAGFTTMRDCQSVGTMYSDTDVRRGINEGWVPGPRLQVAPLAIYGTSFLPPERGFSPQATVIGQYGRIVNSPWEGRAAVRDNIRYGADFIKLFLGGLGWHFEPDGKLWEQTTLTLEEDKAIVDEAHRQGVKVACHAWGNVPLRDSIEAACDSIELGIDLDPESISKMTHKGIFLTMEFARGKALEASNLQATQGKYSILALQKVSFQRALKAGVKIGFGPNYGGPGRVSVSGAQAKDLKYMVEYGMTTAQALHAVTSVNAEMMGWQDRVGSIKKGKYADIIAVSGNPLDDITEPEHVKFVMKGGEIVRNDLR
jgi:imidazolonepropionase-like amidohydrolase